MKFKKSLFFIVAFLSSVPAFAGWQHNGYYIKDGYYSDDGSRFVIGLRGGLSIANAKIKNDVGNLDAYYYVEPKSGKAVSVLYFGIDDEVAQSNGFPVRAVGNVGSLPAKENFSKTAFTAGMSVGFSVPHHQQWRLEAGFDHISEMEYNQVPLFDGNINVSGIYTDTGEEYNGVIQVSSSGVTSTISTDIISVMAYYDFFEGLHKPVNKFIPYVGFGVGYAVSRTTLKLSDIYGDLSTEEDLTNYGTREGGVIQFTPPTDKSLYPSSTNIAAIGAVGASYGLSEYTFLDFSARVMYVPQIKWNLVNSEGTMHREWFSAKNMFYTNLMIGLRFEF